MMGLTQQDIAELLGHRSTCLISRWERGLAMPSADSLLNLGVLYGTLNEELYYDLYRQKKEKFIKKLDAISDLRKRNKLKG
jgi:transcriptional regulator with XRE-family HTH domain